MKSIDIKSLIIGTLGGLAKVNEAESLQQTTDRTSERSGEAHAVGVSVAQRQPRPHQGSDCCTAKGVAEVQDRT